MKKKETVEILGKIYDYTLEEIMGERFSEYAKDIIQNRAIPDVRDGLKPVQRRILYAMYRDKNTYEKAHKKSATAVASNILSGKTAWVNGSKITFLGRLISL